MKPIRVLLADDARSVRYLLGEVLADDPDIEVVGSAANGKILLRRLTTAEPDIVILDIEMPEMDGLEALRQLRSTHPSLPVIMFSSLTERGARATIEALRLGASDYLAKPQGSDAVPARTYIEKELITRIKALARPRKFNLAPARRLAPNKVRGNVGIVAIGSSTGGPAALGLILSQLPKGLPVPVVVAQHMPAVFSVILAQRLNETSRLKVAEATHGAPLEAGCVYLAPGGYHLEVLRARGRACCSLNQDPPVHACRPAVDVLFHSVAKSFGRACLAVVLTGMGSDGALGAAVLSDKGAQVIVQDQASAVVWGMPGSVVQRGAADRIVDLSAMAGEIALRTNVLGNKRAAGG